MSGLMLRLLLGLLVAIGLLYGGMQLMGRTTEPSAANTGPRQPPEVRRAMSEVQRIEAQNRAAMDRVVRTAEQAR
jgi:hypothetical protein